MAPKNLLGHAAILMLSCGQMCRGAFTTDFSNVTQGSPLNLEWDAIEAGSYPLIIGVSLINKTGGSLAYGLKTDVSTSVTDSSLIWQDVPYPSRFIPTAMYRLEIRPSTWEGEQQPVLARSTYFSIQESTPETGSYSPTGDGSGAPGTSTTPGANSKLGIALGVSIGLPTLVAGGVVGWCCRKKRRKAKQEKRWQKRMEFVIN